MCRSWNYYKDVSFHSKVGSHWKEALSRRMDDLYQVLKGPLWLLWREKAWQLVGVGTVVGKGWRSSEQGHPTVIPVTPVTGDHGLD